MSGWLEELAYGLGDAPLARLLVAGLSQPGGPSLTRQERALVRRCARLAGVKVKGVAS